MNHKSFFPDWTVAYCTSGLEHEIQRCQMKQNLNHIQARKKKKNQYQYLKNTKLIALNTTLTSLI